MYGICKYSAIEQELFGNLVFFGNPNDAFQLDGQQAELDHRIPRHTANKREWFI